MIIQMIERAFDYSYNVIHHITVLLHSGITVVVIDYHDFFLFIESTCRSHAAGRVSMNTEKKKKE
jgi:hypothetical protein